MESEDDMMTQRGNLKRLLLFLVYLCYQMRLVKMKNRYNEENVRE